MVKLPEVLGLIPCERFHVDAQAHRLSLVGISLSLQFPVFPARIHELIIYAALFDARGEGEMRLTYSRLETEEDLHYNSRWSSFPAPGRITQIVLPLRELVVPAPGRYSITLSFDRRPISICYFDVLRG
jgi:hypothetical protein